MYNSIKSGIFLLLVFNSINISFAQTVIEIPFKPLDDNYKSLAKTLSDIDDYDETSIEIAFKELSKSDDAFIRYDMIFWELVYHYAAQKKYNKCLEILQTGQEEGFFYFLREGERPFPDFLPELTKLDGYKSFYVKNEQLQIEANKNANTEYMIQLPKEYNSTKNYPLFVVLHGGFGSITGLQFNYDSQKLKSDFIVAYFQGSVYDGSHLRSFNREKWQEEIKDGYNQIKKKYAVDTTNVIFAGPSAGGARSIILGLRNIIPTKGLLLSFPVVPIGLDSTDYISSAKNGLRAALICNENDWGLKKQKELAYYFDMYEIPNRFVVFPEKGHEFPDNWEYYLNTSLEYLIKDE